MGSQVEIRQPYTQELTKLNKKVILRTEVTRETMDFKSSIFIFVAALIFILPLAISSSISGAGGGVEGYISSVGACRGGYNPENNAGMTKYLDRNCRNRCDQDSSCQAYVVPVSGANWCETYTSIAATGDGRSAYQCFSKACRQNSDCGQDNYWAMDGTPSEGYGDCSLIKH